MPDQLTDRLRPAIHPVYARMLCAWLRQQGFDLATIFRGTRLSWNLLSQDNRFISLEQMSRLIRRGIDLTEKPWLGLEVGLSTQVSAHGPVGYAAVSAPDVRTMLREITRFAPLRLQLLQYGYEEHGDEIELITRETVDLGDAREYILGASATVLFLMIQTTTGQPLRDARMHFPFPEPPWLTHYQQAFGDQLEFDAAYYHVRVSRDLLDWPSLTADSEAYHLSLLDCERLLQQAEAGGALTQRIRHRLLDCAGHYPTLEDMAEELGLSRRTLIRHLKQEGSAYQVLLDDVRKELAVWYLEQTSLPVDQVAERLGYQDPSNFSRTFRRWFGQTPRDLRREVRADE